MRHLIIISFFKSKVDQKCKKCHRQKCDHRTTTNCARRPTLTLRMLVLPLQDPNGLASIVQPEQSRLLDPKNAIVWHKFTFCWVKANLEAIQCSGVQQWFEVVAKNFDLVQRWHFKLKKFKIGYTDLN